MGATKFSGPVRSSGGFAFGGGTDISYIQRGTASVVVSALAAGAEEDISVTVTGAQVGDSIMFNPTIAAAETGLGIMACWVSAADTVILRVSNFHTNALAGSTANWPYLLVRS